MVVLEIGRWLPRLKPWQRQAQDADELSKQLFNPIASLIGVAFQSNVDVGAAGSNVPMFQKHLRRIVQCAG
jgi:hypothetical protein